MLKKEEAHATADKVRRYWINQYYNANLQISNLKLLKNTNLGRIEYVYLDLNRHTSGFLGKSELRSLPLHLYGNNKKKNL